MPFASALRCTLVALVALTACDDVSGLDGRYASARRQWIASRPTRYEFKLHVSCFCGFPPQPVTITVNGDSIVSATDATGAPIVAQLRSTYTSIDGLFAVVQGAIDRDAYQLDVAYDPLRGYPTSIAIDYRKNVADDEVSYTVSGFVPR